jgi:hypothetical protein
VGNEKNLQDILTENGFHSILYYAPHQKIKKIDCNPWILNKRKLNKDLDQYIKKNLTSIGEDSLDNLLTNYNESLEKNKDDPNRYIALLEIALATDTYKKKLQSETKLREETDIINLDFVALSEVALKHTLPTILEDTLYTEDTLYPVKMKTTIYNQELLMKKTLKDKSQELLTKKTLKNKNQELLIEKQTGNNSYKKILIQNIGSLKSSYKNDDLENNIDDMLNFAFSAITSLASSLLCCGSPPSTRPKTITHVTHDIKATILSDGKVKQHV